MKDVREKIQKDSLFQTVEFLEETSATLFDVACVAVSEGNYNFSETMSNDAVYLMRVAKELPRIIRNIQGFIRTSEDVEALYREFHPEKGIYDEK